MHCKFFMNSEVFYIMKDFFQKIPLSVKFFLLFALILSVLYFIVGIIMTVVGFVTFSEILIKFPLCLVLFLVLHIFAYLNS